ncbi:MAG TPA: alkaline phosphatase PhoX [Gemmatimonadota bacterium]
MHRRRIVRCCVTVAALCGAGPGPTLASAQSSPDAIGGLFKPLPNSAACTPGGNAAKPFLLPPGFKQTVTVSEPAFPDLPDMTTENEFGPAAGRVIFRTHELTSNAAVSTTDRTTGATTILAQRADWERFDGIAWTPWKTILAAEEVVLAGFPDPSVPEATAGLVYEIDPGTGNAVARPAIGSRSHEGLRFDADGNLYGISENSPPTGGYLYKFVPDAKGDLSSGRLFALKITVPDGDRTGKAVWVPLSRKNVKADSDAEATAAGATGYARPEDVETGTSTGNVFDGRNVLYVAVTGEARILGIDLLGGKNQAFVFEYAKAGGNAPADFEFPDNVALDKDGNLFITEDPGTASTTGLGDDIWVAVPPRPQAGPHAPAREVIRFASLTDCNAEPTGVYFDRFGFPLIVHAQHRGGDGFDKEIEISKNVP